MMNEIEGRHEEKLEVLDKRVSNLELHYAEIRADTRYIIKQIDDGLSKTVQELFLKFHECYPGIKEDHAAIIWLRRSLITFIITAVCGGIITIVFAFIHKGLNV